MTWADCRDVLSFRDGNQGPSNEREYEYTPGKELGNFWKSRKSSITLGENLGGDSIEIPSGFCKTICITANPDIPSGPQQYGTLSSQSISQLRFALHADLVVPPLH